MKPADTCSMFVGAQEAYCDSEIVTAISVPVESQTPKNIFSDWGRLVFAIVPILFLSFNSSTISSAQSGGRGEVLLRVIVVNTENEAKQILEELRNGKEFGTIAKNKSIDPSAGFRLSGKSGSGHLAT
jgi:hypothetical protein